MNDDSDSSSDSYDNLMVSQELRPGFLEGSDNNLNNLNNINRSDISFRKQNFSTSDNLSDVALYLLHTLEIYIALTNTEYCLTVFGLSVCMEVIQGDLLPLI